MDTEQILHGIRFISGARHGHGRADPPMKPSLRPSETALLESTVDPLEEEQ